jgi:sugar phosphate isomerase/epimerase
MPSVNTGLKLATTSLLWGNPRGDKLGPWLDEVVELGFQGVSGFSDWGWEDYVANPKTFASETRARDLGLASIIAPMDLDFDRYRRIMELLRACDSEVLVLLGGFGKTNREVSFVIDLIGYLAEIAKDAGIYVTYHNHTDNTGETYAEFCRLMDAVPAHLRSVMVDVGHATKDFVDLPDNERATAALKRFSSELRLVELKDFSADRHLNTPLGEGRLELRAVADAVADIGYRGWLVLEQNGNAAMWREGKARQDAKTSLAAVKEAFGW